MKKDLLLNIGLTENEIRAYDLLLTFTELTPPEIAERLELTRTNSYAVLKSLTNKGLIREKIKGKKLTYYASSPENVRIYAESQLKEMEHNVENLELLMPRLESRYETLTNKEGSRDYEGIEGLKVIFDDILREKENVYIICSNFEDKRKTVLEAYKDQFRRMTKRNIKTKILVPNSADFSYKFFSKYRSELVEVRKLDKEVFCLESEVIIYGKNAALISQKDDFITVQIDDKNIAQTLRTLFQAFWK